MQTFLPFPSFADSARALDWRRLGKQRVEAWQILRALRGESKGWRNHPAVRMWRGHEAALCAYGLAVCGEWKLRGYRDTLEPRFLEALLSYPCPHPCQAFPEWIGRPEFHAAHRSNLIRKDPTFYRERFPDTPEGLPYVWPVGKPEPFEVRVFAPLRLADFRTKHETGCDCLACRPWNY